MDTSARLAVLGSIADALGLKPTLNPPVANLFQPCPPRVDVHGHEVLVQEADEVDFVGLFEVLDHSDDVLRAVVPDVASIGLGRVKQDVRLALVILHVFHIPADPQVKAELADQRAPVRGIDVEPSLGHHTFFRKEDLAVLEIDFLQREKLIRRTRKRIEVFQ